MAGTPSPRHDIPTPSKSSELATRVVAGIAMAVLAVAAAWAGGYVFLVFWVLAALAVWWEWTGVVRAEPRPLLVAIGGVAIAGIAVSLAADAIAFTVVCALVGAGVAMAATAERRVWAGAGVFYAALVLVPVVLLRGDGALGLVAVLWLFAVVWAEDTGAYFTGRYFGGPKLAPQISPNKTWSGAAGGTLAGIAAGCAVVVLAGLPLHAMHVVIGFLVVVAAQAGDLLESGLKRHFAVKDASNLLPGHGGLMDRLDGFLIAAAVAVIAGFIFGGESSPAMGLLRW